MHSLTEIKVRGYHADFYGHVNNARYLEFFEEDRWAHFESRIDLRSWAEMGLMFLVVNINVNYRKAVAVGETLLFSTSLHKIGTKSAVLRQEIVLKRSGDVVCDALVTFVIQDRDRKTVSMEGDIVKELLKFGPPDQGRAT